MQKQTLRNLFSKSEDLMLINLIPIRLKKYTFKNTRPLSNIRPVLKGRPYFSENTVHICVVTVFGFLRNTVSYVHVTFL